MWGYWRGSASETENFPNPFLPLCDKSHWRRENGIARQIPRALVCFHVMFVCIWAAAIRIELTNQKLKWESDGRNKTEKHWGWVNYYPNGNNRPNAAIRLPVELSTSDMGKKRPNLPQLLHVKLNCPFSSSNPQSLNAFELGFSLSLPQFGWLIKDMRKINDFVISTNDRCRNDHAKLDIYPSPTDNQLTDWQELKCH